VISPLVQAKKVFAKAGLNNEHQPFASIGGSSGMTFNLSIRS